MPFTMKHLPGSTRLIFQSLLQSLNLTIELNTAAFPMMVSIWISSKKKPRTPLNYCIFLHLGCKSVFMKFSQLNIRSVNGQYSMSVAIPSMQPAVLQYFVFRYGFNLGKLTANSKDVFNSDKTLFNVNLPWTIYDQFQVSQNLP